MQKQNLTTLREQATQNKRNMSLPSIDHFKIAPRADPNNPKAIAQRFLINPPFDYSIYQNSKPYVFNIPKDTLHNNQKAYITNNKNTLPNKQGQTPTTSNIKKRIQQLTSLQKQVYSNNNESLNSILYEFGLLNKSQTVVNDTKVNIYQPQRKFSYQKRKEKLKPILNQSDIKEKQSHFFNIERKEIFFCEGKKSKGILQRFPIDSEDQGSSFLIKRNPKEIELSSSPVNKQKKQSHEQQQVNHKQMVHHSLGKPQLRTFDFNTVVINTFEPKHSTKQFVSRKYSELQIKRQARKTIQKPSQKQKDKEQVINQPKPKMPRFNKKFEIPYPTYHYRDLIWKINFTNQIFVEPPLQYEHRVKAFVGKGNNSCMVSGLICRRPWFAITDKLEQANFVWTQLKQLSFFKRQSSLAENSKCIKETNQYKMASILTTNDYNNFRSYFKTHFSSEQHADQRMQPRCKYFKYKRMVKSSQISQQKMQNHLKNNYILGNKKALFNTMSNYYRQIKEDVFDYLPLTFHIKQGLQDQKYFQFLKYYHKKSKKAAKNNEDKTKKKEYNAWIIKPGENSNRGNGIKMCLNLEQIKTILKKRERYQDGTYRTYIVQSYIQRPLLYNKRKFDLRHYMMITCVKGLIKGYWYKDGYVRTTSSEYSLKDNSGSIHLTNDAVQKNLADYGKYEKGNKLSYEQLSAYIEKYHKQSQKGFYQTIYPKMKKIATDSIKACSGGIDPEKLQNNFQVFGLDFMIDANLDVWLIEINTNPCLELSCPLLGCIIPKMVQNALELTMDAMFPPPVRYSPKGLHYYKQLQKENRFELVYDERMQNFYEGCLTVLDNKLLQQQEDTFQDCGQDWEDS